MLRAHARRQRVLLQEEACVGAAHRLTVTLRLRPGALDALARTLQYASMELHRAAPEEQTLRLLPPTGALN